MSDTAPLTPRRRILTAELLSIGTELTVGETRDTNAGELAGRLTAAGGPVRPGGGLRWRPDHGAPRRPRGRHGGVRDRPRSRGSGRFDGRARADPRRPDARG